jgi:hypothetical protein
MLFCLFLRPSPGPGVQWLQGSAEGPAELGELVGVAVIAQYQAGLAELRWPRRAGRIPDGLCERICGEFSDAQVLDILLPCGWYHAISFAANGAPPCPRGRRPELQ